MKNKENNNYKTLPAKKDNAALIINSKQPGKKSFMLSHMFNFDRSCLGVRSVNVSTDNRYLIITFEDYAKIRVLDLEKLEFMPHKYKGHTRSIRLTSIANDNKAFYTASWDCSFRGFDIASGKCIQILNGLGRSPSCYLEEKQKLLFTASYDSDYDLKSVNTGRCWNLASGEVMHKYKHTKERKNIECIDIVYDQKYVYTGSDDGFAYKWNLTEETPLLKFFEFEGSVRKVAVSANYFAAACTDGKIRVHDKISGKYFRYFFHGKTDVREVRISRDETRIWGAAEDGSVSCFNLMTGKLLYHRKLHSHWIWSMCLMNDEKILVTGSGDGAITFISSDTGNVLAWLYNLPVDNDFLITCPPDKAFPNGFFYTTNKDFIQVLIGEKEKPVREELELNDPRREAYINKLNLKNLIITRLKNNGHYTSLTEQYMQNQKILNRASDQKLPYLLKA